MGNWNYIISQNLLFQYFLVRSFGSDEQYDHRADMSTETVEIGHIQARICIQE